MKNMIKMLAGLLVMVQMALPAVAAPCMLTVSSTHIINVDRLNFIEKQPGQLIFSFYAGGAAGLPAVVRVKYESDSARDVGLEQFLRQVRSICEY